MRIYLDNAATTSLSKEVFQAMEPYLFENFGNPSSSHAYGRTARLAIEESRATIADLLHTSPAQLIFTSGGTEADNTAIISAIRSNGIKVAVTSPLEHHAVLHTLECLKRNNEITLIYLKPDENGNLSTAQLTQILEATERAFVSVMHGNNEIGNLNNIEEIGEICYRYNAIFHTDTVQTMGHYKYDTRQLKADFLVGSAHKFHGPKGIGFLYKSNTDRLIPLINGGAQEKGQRSGTENVAGIVGLAKALTLAYQQTETNHHHIIKLKQKMIKDLTHNIPGIRFNGNSADTELSLPTVLSVVLPDTVDGQSPINYLDQHNICVSGGSACNSAASGSHVLTALGNGFEGTTVRFSFGRYNTEEEIDYVVNKLVNLYVRETLKEMSAFC
jgi:cysteine desulfurase